MARRALLSLLATSVVGTSLAVSPGPVAALAADTTAPQVVIAAPAASPESPVHVGDVLTADFTCTDPAVEGADISGVASCNGILESVPDPSDPEPAVVDPTPVLSGQQLDTSLPGTFRLVVTGSDLAGNHATTSVTFTVAGRSPADVTAPEVNVLSPVDGAEITVGADVRADYSCQDAESGLVRCDGDVTAGQPVDTAVVGAHTFTVTAEDAAGNVVHRTVHYEVVARQNVILRGRIQDETGAGLTGGTVEAMLTGTNGVVARTIAGSDGRYNLALHAGTYDLRFRGPSSSGLGADLVGRDLAADTNLDVTLVPFVTRVSVQMSDGMGGEVLSGNVTAYTPSMAYAGTWPVGSTGQADLTLTAGEYYLTYSGVSRNAQAFFYGETDVLTLDQDRTVALRPDTRSMSLTLRDADGSPVTAEGYYTCVATRPAGRREVLESVSQQNVVITGSAEIPVLAASDAAGCELHLRTSAGLAFTRVLGSGLASYEVELADPVQVTGQVSDGVGGRFARGQVTVSGGQTGRLSTSTMVGPDGQFSLLLEPAGYRLFAGGSSDRLDHFTVARTVSATTDTVIDLGLDPAPRPVHLVVERSDGSRVAGDVEVTCSAGDGNAHTLRYVRHVNGEADIYALTGDGAPACGLWVRPPGEAQVYRQLDGSEGTVTVVVPRTVHVTGTVSDGVGGAPRHQATVQALTPTNEPGGLVTSDEAGGYDLPLAEGDYRLQGTGSSHRVGFYSVLTTPRSFPADQQVDLRPDLLKLSVHLRGPDGGAVHGRADLSCATSDVTGLAFQEASSHVEFTGTGALWGMSGTGWDGGPACWLNIYPDSGAPVVRRVAFEPGTPKDLVVYTAGGVVLEQGVDAGHDSDNVSDLVEALGPNGGDGNADGVADYLQQNVTSLPVSGGGSGHDGYLTVAVPSGTSLNNVSTLPLHDASITSAPPQGVTLPEGLVQFRLDGVPAGSDQTVSLYPSSTAGLNGYAKYHDGAWSTLPDDRVTIVSGQTGPDRVDVRLTDGGVGDDDDVADGSILDPGGLAVLQRDQRAPSVSVTGVTDGSRHHLGAAPRAGCVAHDEDGGTGLAGPCSVTVTGGNANGVGDFTVRATAEDRAGNVATTVARYRVEYRFDGFLQPINGGGHPGGLSVFQGGSTVPVGFRLQRADGSVVAPLTAPQWLTPQRGDSTSAGINEALWTEAPTSGDAFVPVAGQWLYNWSTRRLPTGYRYRIGVRLDDGTTHQVVVAVR